MTNILKLKAKIVEAGFNTEQVAEAIGMNTSTLYRKLSRKGESFTISEANKICKLLKLSAQEVNDIFFAENVADMR